MSTQPTSEPDAAALRARAQEVLGVAPRSLGAAGPHALLTPALPAAWPDAGGRVVFLRYLTQAQPTSLETSRLTLAPEQAEGDVAAGTVRAAPVAGAGPLGDELAPLVDGPAPDALARAEQALVEVVAGRRAADDARADLAPYRQWLERHPLIAEDLARRHGAFVGWLRAR